MAGETAIRPVTRFPVDQDHYRAKIAAHIDDLKTRGGRSMLKDLLDRLFRGMGPVPSDVALITATIKSGADSLESFCRRKPAGLQDVLLSSVADIAGGEYSRNLGLGGVWLCNEIAVFIGLQLAVKEGRVRGMANCVEEPSGFYHFLLIRVLVNCANAG